MSVDPHLAGLSGTVVHDVIVPARAPWLHHVAAGQTLRIVDLEGNQAVDFLLYATADDAERYSAQDTVAAQGNLFLREGTVLRSNEGRAMMTIAATSVDYHDTIGGACSCESNTLRYGHHTKAEHACVENFLEANLTEGRGKRDIVSNINFSMNVPVEPDGSTTPGDATAQATRCCAIIVAAIEELGGTAGDVDHLAGGGGHHVDCHGPDGPAAARGLRKQADAPGQREHVKGERQKELRRLDPHADAVEQPLVDLVGLVLDGPCGGGRHWSSSRIHRAASTAA